MSALDVDPDITTFTTALTAYARKQYQGGQMSTANLHTAIRRGWTPLALAKECSAGRPSSAAIQSRLEWCAQHAPKTQQAAAEKGAKPARKPHCGQCYSDDYRWECDDQDRPIRPCPRCSNASTVERRTA